MIMTQSLLEEVRAFIGRNNLTRTGSLADEQDANVKSALRRVIPLVVSSFIEMTEQPGGRETMWDLAREAARSRVLTNPLAALKGASSGQNRGVDLLKTALGDRHQSAINSIASATGIQTAAAHELVNVVVPVTLGLIGDQITEHNWNAEALEQWLQAQRDEHPAQTVVALSAASVPELPAFNPPVLHPPAANRNGWLWLALVVAASIIGYLLGHKPDANAGASAASMPVTMTANKGPWDAINPAAISANGNYSKAGGSYIYDRSGVPVVLKLKGGLRQIIGPNSTENKLYQFLASPNTKVDPDNPTKDWITFDRIYFESNKATLTNESMWQLSNVASILQTFPTAKVRLGGYTDSTGTLLLNLKLSKARAQAAKATLVKMGIAPGNVDVRGYGSLYAIASNRSVDGRSLNRRVSIRVTKK